MKIIYHDKPFRLDETNYPFGKVVHVVDNYMEDSLWRWWDRKIVSSNIWSKTNQVSSDSKTGLPQHSFWGGTFFNSMHHNHDGLDIPEETQRKDTYMAHFFDRKVRTDFGFEWVNYDYMGLNSQTQGLDGTNHSDCEPDKEWNLSFLFYLNTFWNPNWGGDLRFYDHLEPSGAGESQDKYEIARVQFKPNRLLLFDGRIPHGAEAPKPCAKYIDRRSIVHRGTEIRFADKEDETRRSAPLKHRYNRWVKQHDFGNYQ